MGPVARLQLPLDSLAGGHACVALAGRAQKQADALTLGILKHQQRRRPLFVAQQACTDRSKTIGGQIRQLPRQVKVLHQPGLQLSRAFDRNIQRRGIGEQPVGLHGIGHGRNATGQQACFTGLPAPQAADAQGHQQHRRCGPVTLPALALISAHGSRVQPWVQGLFGQPGQCRTQLPGIGTPAFDTRRLLGVGRQVQLYLAAAPRLQVLIDISVQFFFGRNQPAHFNLRNAAGAVLPSASSRNAARARDKRDITVPMGTSRAWAASL
ncbi:hypothetical protein D9M71_198740 [compost metagenome]